MQTKTIIVIKIIIALNGEITRSVLHTRCLKKNGLFFSFLDQFKDDLVSLLSKLKLSMNFY